MFRIFTENELDYSLGKQSYAETLAGKFAAKEAVIKAIGKFVAFSKIEILNKSNGIAYVAGRNDLLVSISHEKGYAVAAAIKVGDNENSID